MTASLSVARMHPILPEGTLEEEVQRWGQRLFDRIEAAEPRWFHRESLRRALMDWAMQDDQFKTQLFRFVDVLPSLHSAAEVSRHFREYLSSAGAAPSTVLRLALQAARTAPALFGLVIRQQVTGMAHQFMLGEKDGEIVQALRRRRAQQIGFTLDVLGETVVSEQEADAYAQRYLHLIDLLSAEPHLASVPAGRSPQVDWNPPLNLSVKVSALCSQIQSTDPVRALERISLRLRPILRRAKDVGALVNLDMEQYALKPLTLALFQQIFAEPEFAVLPAAGLALQAYLRDSEEELNAILDWARTRQRPVIIRLVKGAYWDYESVIAAQKGWPVPVFSEKHQTDANYERLSRLLLENHPHVHAAFGTHNVRSIAHAVAQAQRLNLGPDDFEFQMLHGMADSTKTALVQLGYQVREYSPVGELLPGMAYLVRRLLENTSNEGFLAQHRNRHRTREELLQPPRSDAGSLIQVVPFEEGRRVFRNEPPTDFTVPAERERFTAAIARLRKTLGRRHPLIIDNRLFETRDWLPSVNPANSDEVIGYAAQATLDDANAALSAARGAALPWARTAPTHRAALLERLAALLVRSKDELSALEVLEAGKNWMEADADVGEAIDFCRFYALAMCERGVPQVTQAIPGESNVLEWWPRGTGLVVAPWNFPLAILTGMTMAAIVAGNTVVMKPSDQTPVLAARLMDLLIEAGLPAGVANFVTGPGSSIGAHLVASPKIDFIAFTGSKEVGLGIWEAAGKTRPGQAAPKQVICEMGGKNAMIIDNDADLDEAVAGVIASAFGYSGQKCSALSRLILLSEIHDRFLERLISAAASLPVGPAEQPGTIIGPVISAQAQQRILTAIEHGKSEGRLAWQGAVPADPKAFYVTPTIFVEVPPSSRLFQEEIFGPLLSVTRATDFEHALFLANASAFALTGGLYSRDPEHIERARREFVCGNFYINRSITGALVERQPFGGFKMSGGGTKAGGRAYLEHFMIPRVITENQLRRGFAPNPSAKL